ncbi:MAG: DUF3788 family protein [Brevefilum sp.]
MAYERLLDKEQTPDQALIEKRIGREVLPVWQETQDYLAENFPAYSPELVYYSTQHGWALRYRKEAQQLCTLFPEKGAFSAMIVLSPEEEQFAQEKFNFFNARIRELLSRPSSLPQGRWLWMRIEDHTDFVGLRLLLEIKK